MWIFPRFPKGHPRSCLFVCDFLLCQILQIQLQFVPQHIQYDRPDKERGGIRNDERPNDSVETTHSVGEIEHTNQRNAIQKEQGELPSGELNRLLDAMSEAEAGLFPDEFCGLLLLVHSKKEV